MLALYALDDDPTLYLLAADNARDAQTRAANGEGLYLLSWNGETLPRDRRRTGDAADAGRHHQRVRLAGGLSAAGVLAAGAGHTPVKRRVRTRRGSCSFARIRPTSVA